MTKGYVCYNCAHENITEEKMQAHCEECNALHKFEYNPFGDLIGVHIPCVVCSSEVLIDELGNTCTGCQEYYELEIHKLQGIQWLIY